MEKENTKRKAALPTLIQLRALIELEGLGGKWGDVSLIADRCGVSQVTVSRYFKKCITNGYLQKDFQFTEAGKVWLTEYKTLLVKLTRYLREIGIPENELEDNVAAMIENLALYTLKKMTDDNGETLVQKTIKAKKSVRFSSEEAEATENCLVYYKILSMRSKGTHKNNFSMANNGFEQDAYLRHQKEQDMWYLEMTIKDMSAPSRINGEKMIGRLETLKFYKEEVLTRADIVDGKVKIPLQYCNFRWGTGLERIGFLTVTLTCSVGGQHMPESTALLFFSF